MSPAGTPVRSSSDAQHVRGEVVGPHGREPAAVAAERRPDRVDDQRVAHPSSSS